MTHPDPATQAWIERQLDEAPPLTPEQAALVVRTFARTPTPDTAPAMPDAA